MPATESKCPKCNGDMQQGFVMDNSYRSHLVSHWAAGEPHKSFWTGTKTPGEGLIPIGTFRCRACGFLESYALPGYEAK